MAICQGVNHESHSQVYTQRKRGTKTVPLGQHFGKQCLLQKGFFSSKVGTVLQTIGPNGEISVQILISQDFLFILQHQKHLFLKNRPKISAAKRLNTCFFCVPKQHNAYLIAGKCVTV